MQEVSPLLFCSQSRHPSDPQRFRRYRRKYLWRIHQISTDLLSVATRIRAGLASPLPSFHSSVRYNHRTGFNAVSSFMTYLYHPESISTVVVVVTGRVGACCASSWCEPVLLGGLGGIGTAKGDPLCQLGYRCEGLSRSQKTEMPHAGFSNETKPS